MVLLLLSCTGEGEGPLGLRPDAPCEEQLFFEDLDRDGFGTDVEVWACEKPGWAARIGGDCDDTRAAVNPEAEERCATARDDNCDGETNDGADGETWYVDADQDGFGDEAVIACSWPEGHATLDGDCDDSDAAINPRADETCNEVDDDCDEAVDEFVGSVFYTDEDGDGYGSGQPLDLCEPPDDAAERGGDCDDSDPDLTERGIYFEGSLIEFDNGDTWTIPGDGLVQICKGTWNIRIVADSVAVDVVGVAGAQDTVVSGAKSGTPLTMVDSDVTLTDLTLLDGSGTSGGCVYAESSTVSMSGVTIRDCSAVDGAGVYATNSDLTMTDGSLRDNLASGLGGGVYVDYGPVTFSNTIQSNMSASSGGAVYLGSEAVGVVSGGEIHDCKATNGAGVAVVGGSWSGSQTTVRNNASQGAGGGFYVKDGSVAMDEGEVSANSSSEGGGVYLAAGGTFAANETDCGQGASDNQPNDVRPVSADMAYSWDGTCTTTCDDSGCD